MTKYLNIAVPPLEQLLTYAVPEDLEDKVAIGHQVEVPLAKRQALGYVIAENTEIRDADNNDYEIKPISNLALGYPSFHESQLSFFTWIADYYGESISKIIDLAVPRHVPAKYHRTVLLNPSEQEAPRGRLQRELLRFLRDNNQSANYSELLKRYKGASASLKKLDENDYIRIETTELIDSHIDSSAAPSWAKEEVTLNEKQLEATKEIISKADNKEFNQYLLYGVTGSGKTEVYIEAIKVLLEQGLGALVIVPEIALTPQLIDRFRARLGNNIAVLHSALKKRARWDSWRALIEGRNMVAIGARSAVFAPVKNLSLIIVDEEHDNSYKQSEGIRYNARDLAIVRAKQRSCPVVLGSATPSLESFYNTATKKYSYLSLPERHSSASNIDIEIVDLNSISPWQMSSKNISPRLFELIFDALANQEQAFILYNRRGFATYLQCEQCATTMECPNCSVTLTYHQHTNALQCHYCNYQLLRPKYCPNCPQSLSPDSEAMEEMEAVKKPGQLILRGAGTEKILEEVKELFPGIAVDKLDRDSASNASEYKAILNRVRSGQSQILVGTQMIAKGHDLPNVTVVGIVDCDVGLHMPDFRAAERVYQLLTQASGRAGRSEKAGKVVLQTRVPKHLSLVKTLTKDYRGFAKAELHNRRTLNYPPFSRILRVIARSQDQAQAREIITSFRLHAHKYIQQQGLQIALLGPSPAPLEKLKTQWRWHLLFKSQSASQLNCLLKELKSTKVHSRKVKVSFDLDPQEML